MLEPTKGKCGASSTVRTAGESTIISRFNISSLAFVKAMHGFFSSNSFVFELSGGTLWSSYVYDIPGQGLPDHRITGSPDQGSGIKDQFNIN